MVDQRDVAWNPIGFRNTLGYPLIKTPTDFAFDDGAALTQLAAHQEFDRISDATREKTREGQLGSGGWSHRCFHSTLGFDEQIAMFAVDRSRYE